MRTQKEIEDIRLLLLEEAYETYGPNVPSNPSQRFIQIAAAQDALAWVLGIEPNALDAEAVEFFKARQAARKSGEPGEGIRGVRCSDCKGPVGAQHKPSCHREGIITSESDYRRLA